MPNTLFPKLIRWLLCSIPFVYCCFIYIPPCLDINGWKLFGLFLSTILGFILRPAPMGSIALLSLTIAAFCKMIALNMVFDGFADSTTWLIVSVFFLAQGVINTGLSSRIAYFFIRFFGKNVLGLSYSLAVTDFLISPFIPTAGAKTGSIIIPIINSIVEASQRQTNNNSTKLKNFLLLTCSNVNAVNSAIFLFGTSSTAIVYSISKNCGVTISWLSWLNASIVPGILSLIFLPSLIFYFFTKGEKINTDFSKIATSYLQNIGSITKKEIYMILILGLMLFLWMNNETYNLNIAVTAILGVNLMMLFGLVKYEHIIANKSAWNTLVWFGTIMMFSKRLSQYDIISYFSSYFTVFLSRFDWKISFLILCLIYFYIHYCFAGGATHVTSLYQVFLLSSFSLGMPKIFCILVLGFFSNLFSSLTHYASVSSALLFENSSMSSNAWCKYNFIFSSFIFLIWIISGFIWWKLIGLY